MGVLRYRIVNEVVSFFFTIHRVEPGGSLLRYPTQTHELAKKQLHAKFLFRPIMEAG